MDMPLLADRISKLCTKIIEGASPIRSRLIRCIDYFFYDIDDEEKHAIDECHRLNREVREEYIQAINEAFLYPRSC